MDSFSHLHSLSEVFKDVPVPPADTEYLGVWGNNLNLEELIWMMNIGKTPVYFAHQLTKEEVVDRQEGYTYCPGTMTKLETHFSPENPYQIFAKDISRSQGHKEPQQACDYTAAMNYVNKLEYGYHDWEEGMEGYWEWHKIIPGPNCLALMEERIPMMVILVEQDIRFRNRVEETWFEQKLGIALHFTFKGRLEFPSSYMGDPGIFDVPVPRWRAYHYMEDNESLIQTDPLQWMYSTPEPHHKDIGHASPLPALALLP
ncbi:hypothetical protein EV421DRAFT_1739259 [Armillaria borealis]|uniref:Uncharacterized protein n=1 Tax=Armillaria borealis TaxID=47425 RepID=A0AA39J6L2_9AGAR|nr:hypothetical protein EV421DRAFT_1739259 [Armillaria borealis]